jgi:hypothetical protein
LNFRPLSDKTAYCAVTSIQYHIIWIFQAQIAQDIVFSLKIILSFFCILPLTFLLLNAIVKKTGVYPNGGFMRKRLFPRFQL